MAVVVFDPAGFVMRYPVFAAYNTANPGGLQYFFDDAGLYLNNTDCSPITDIPTRQRLLWMITAHLAQLGGATAVTGVGSTASQVGRISEASEGTVKASFDMGTAQGRAAFWNQTQFGAQYWAATGKYRSFRYIRPICNPVGPLWN
jgi:Protein of unknown function (DUF4054)